jgi:macrolide-specific efflux system membrane fusion protein
VHVAQEERRGRRRTVLIGAGAAVLILGAGGWAVFLRPSDSAAAAVTYRATAVTSGTLRQTVSASGTVAATDTEDLSFPASGAVTAVWVTAGQKVTKGQRLAAIDSASLSSAVAAAKATLATAQAKLASDTASGATSTQLAADSASITLATTQVTQATTDLTGATLRAPFAGTVTSVGYVVGQQVGSSSGSGSSSSSSSSSSSGSGSGAGQGTGQGSGSTSDSTAATSSAIHLVSTGSYEIQASVDATDIARIKAGNQAIITVGDSTQNVFGTVSSVGIVATTTSGVASFPVVVAVTGSPTDVYPGATASLQIVYKQLSDVLLVPTLAISRSNGAATVLVQNGDKQERRTIQTGTSSGAQTQVTSGLSEGDQVLVAIPTGAGNGGTGGTTNGRTGRFPGNGTGNFPGGTGNGGGFGNGGAAGNGGGTGTGTGTGKGNGP